MPSTPNFGWPTPEDTAQVANGPAIIRALGDAADATVAALDGRVTDIETEGFRFVGTVYFESDGTFSKANPLGTGDIGLRAIRVRMVGGGGGGGGAEATGSSEASGGGSGGAGAYAESFITDVAGLSASVTVTRGLGGAGGAGAQGGSAGGDSSFGALVLAIGGGGGSFQSAVDVLPQSVSSGGTGTGSIGDFTFRTPTSQRLIVLNDRNIIRPAGPSSPLGGGGGGGRSREPGGDALGFGGGASGALNDASQPARDGGAGGNGIVIIDCFV